MVPARTLCTGTPHWHGWGGRRTRWDQLPFAVGLGGSGISVGRRRCHEIHHRPTATGEHTPRRHLGWIAGALDRDLTTAVFADEVVAFERVAGSRHGTCVGHDDMSPLSGARQGFGLPSTVAYPVVRPDRPGPGGACGHLARRSSRPRPARPGATGRPSPGAHGGRTSRRAPGSLRADRPRR